MTRTVADSALMLEVMAGPHPLDHTTCEAGPADYLGRLHEGVRGKRIAYSPDLGLARVDPDVAALVKSAVARFTELGATVEEVATPWAAPGPELIRFFWAAHMTRLAAASGEVGSADGPRPGRLHQGGARLFGRRIPDDARTQDGLRRRDPSLVRGLGFPADAVGFGRRVPGRTADAGALAAARLGLAVAGRSSPIRSTCPGTPPPACRAASPPTACRSACRSSAGASTISACCRRRRRSSRCSPGRTSGRASAERGAMQRGDQRLPARLSGAVLDRQPDQRRVHLSRGHRGPLVAERARAGQTGGDLFAGGDDGGAVGRVRSCWRSSASRWRRCASPAAWSSRLTALASAEPRRSIARHASRSRRRAAEGAEDIALFPLTIPITTGPGTISVAVALSASRPRTFARRLPGSSSA